METVNIQGLGLVALKQRNLKPGTVFESMWPKAEGETKLVNNSASVFDTLDFIKRVVKGTLNDTKRIVEVLKSSSLQQTLANIHNFHYTHYNYKLDTPGIEQVRRPARSWADRRKGIDCDCFTTSISSMLVNLQIPHYLKIVGINGRDYYQHVYVIVPKTPNADIRIRSNYLVLDPVIDIEGNEKTSFNKEAKNITKQYTKKMIPLEYLNGLVDSDTLGNEFEGLENEVAGLGNDDELGVAQAFRNRMHRHIKNTIRKVEQNPTVVENVVQAPMFTRNLRRLNEAFETNNEAQIMGVLEELSANEDNMLQGQFSGIGAAINTNDDFLYGAVFGELDDNMLSAVDGLGRKGRNNQRQNKANQGKKGFFTKTKNAVKVSKTASKKFGKNAGKVLKKVGKQVVKNNPISLSARLGFLTAMRTNFGTIAERAYWGLQTKDFALSKGISLQYYNAAQALWEQTRKTFVNVLKGDESALRKAILNGRAAKKVATQLKKRGMRGVEEVSGLSGTHGLGAAVASASIASATAFLTPLIAFIKRNFSNIKISDVAKKGVTFIAKRRSAKAAAKSPNEPASSLVVNENGTESEAPPTNTREAVEETVEQSKSPDETVNENDGSTEAAARANDTEPSTTEGARTSATQTDDSGEKKSNTGLIVGGIGLVVVAGLALSSKKKNKSEVNGLGFAAKKESKKLKKSLAKKGIKLPHGYKTEKRKKKVKPTTI